MSQILAMEHRFTDSLQRIACRLHKLSSASSLSRTVLSAPSGAQRFRPRPARSLKYSHPEIRAAIGGNFCFTAPGGSVEDFDQDDADKLAHTPRLLAPAPTRPASLVPH